MTEAIRRAIGGSGRDEHRRKLMLSEIEAVLAYSDLLGKSTSITIDWPKGSYDFLPIIPDEE